MVTACDSSMIRVRRLQRCLLRIVLPAISVMIAHLAKMALNWTSVDPIAQLNNGAIAAMASVDAN